MPNRGEWAEEIVAILTEAGGHAHLSTIYRQMQERGRIDLTSVAVWKSTVRWAIEHRSTDSSLYNPDNEDIFYSVEGKGRGVWGLRATSAGGGTIVAPDSIGENLSDSGESRSPTRVELKIYRVLRDTRLARELKARYNHACQICGVQLRASSSAYYSEAHHIQPLGTPHNGPDVGGNVIVLCPNHHAEFDYGIIALDPGTLEVQHLAPDDPWSGTRIRALHRLGRAYLKYHLERIYKG